MPLSNGSALSVIQSAATEMGINSPVSINLPDLQTQQLKSLYNLTGQMLVKRRVWRQMFAENNFTTVDGLAAYDLPSDFQRPISQTEWDRTNLWPMIGPETPQQWQWLKSGILSTGPRERFRLVGNTLEVWPTPSSNPASGGTPAGLKLSYFYISKWWVTSSDGITRKPAADKDDDSCVFDDRLMISAVKLRFYQAKGFDTTAFAADFQNNLDDAIAQDSGAPILSLSREPQFPLITIYNIPDGNWAAGS